VKILLYGINFAPERIGIGKYTGELAAWLRQRLGAAGYRHAQEHTETNVVLQKFEADVVELLAKA
jgi:threonine aldolase